MYFRAYILVLAVLAASFPVRGNTAVVTVSDEQQKKEPSKAPRKGLTTLTGCVDQQDGGFVLVENRTMRPVVDLSAEGFPQDGFAKYLGRKVTVRGTSSPGTARPLFRVRSVETVSDVCAPEPQDPKEPEE